MELDRDTLLKLYKTMVTIRNFEERGIPETGQRGMSASVHSSAGQEAVPTGMCANLTDDDYIGSTHRGHGHCIAKGVDPKLMMAELFGRIGGCCRGKGGTMHLADFSVGMLGANGIVGGGLPIATGAALAAQLEGNDTVAVAFFGDGASNEGTFHSSLNLAAIWKLPIIFVCENNGWGLSVPASYALSVEDVSVRAVSYDIPGLTVDGTDVIGVYEVMEQAVARARSGVGPTLIECKNYRWDTNSDTKEEDVRGGLNDPVQSMRARLVADGVVGDAIQQVEREVEALVADAVAFALASPFPNPEDALTDVFAT